MFERTGWAAVPMDIVPSATILFIDGYDHDREYWVRRINISSPEYLILEADTGAAGLSLCRSQRIDCVVAELRLPDMSGFQVLLQLVPYARWEIAVVMLSRLSYPQLAELAIKNGAQTYLVKSRISGDDLDRAIHKALVTVPPTRKELRV